MTIRERLEQAHAGRDPERVALKLAILAEDPHAFYRGTPFLFYEELPGRKDAPEIHDGPRVWLCGDAHLENFGSYRADNRLTYFDFNDFDEACLGPPGWDLLRLLASLTILGRMRGRNASSTRKLAAAVIGKYTQELSSGKARWIERDTATGLILQLLDQVRKRKPDHLIRKRTQNGRVRLDGVKALPMDPLEHEELLRFLAEKLPEFEILDAARRIAGNSSLGLPRYVILARAAKAAEVLLDLKAAPAPVPLRFQGKGVRKHQPEWDTEAKRVVSAQNLIQAIPHAFLRPLGCWVLRELLPDEDRVDLADATETAIEEYAETLGRVIAWSQLRASGRWGAACADDLVRFASQASEWGSPLIKRASAAAQITERHWNQFRKAA